MNSSKLLACAALSFVGTTAWLGCDGANGTDGATIPPRPSPGTLVVRGTIAGARGAGTCTQHGADALELVVYDSHGTQFTDAHAPCDAFAVRVPLPAGDYSADARLVDASNAAVSITVPLDGIHVSAGAELTIEIDFPTNSFL